MGNGNSGVFIEKKLRNRQTHNVAAAYDNSPLSCNLHPCFLEHSDDALGRAGYRARLFLPERGHIERMESVHILFLCYGRYYFVLADVFRERQLYQYAVNAIVSVKFANKR